MKVLTANIVGVVFAQKGYYHLQRLSQKLRSFVSLSNSPSACLQGEVPAIETDTRCAQLIVKILLTGERCCAARVVMVSVQNCHHNRLKGTSASEYNHETRKFFVGEVGTDDGPWHPSPGSDGKTSIYHGVLVQCGLLMAA